MRNRSPRDPAKPTSGPARGYAPAPAVERIHPESLSTLRQLLKLHGAPRIRAAIDQIEGEADSSDSASEATGGKYS